MRIFLYGMQSSGASLVAYLLGQMQETVALVDLYSYALVPPLPAPGAEHVVAKAVITTTHELEEHLESFRPNRTILVLRDPVQNYVSLGRKDYADHHGTMVEKFRRLERVFLARERFDLVLEYEDVVTRRGRTVRALRDAEIPVTKEMYSLPRSRDEILAYNGEHSAWCRERYGRGWHFGNIQGDRVKRSLAYKYAPPEVHETVRRVCPGLYRQYRARKRLSPRSLLTRTGALLRDVTVRPVKGAVDSGMETVREAARDVLRALRNPG